MVIFTGTGRCGTTTAAKLFNIPHEFRKREPGALSGNEMSQSAHFGHPYPTLEHRKRAALEHLSYIPMPITLWAESNCMWHPFLDAAYVIDPSVKIVVLVRGMLEFCQSAVFRGEYKRTDWAVKPLPTSPFWEEWDTWTPLQKSAFYWANRNAVIMNALTGVPREQWILCETERLYSLANALSVFTGLRVNEEVAKSMDIFNASNYKHLKVVWTDDDKSQAFDVFERVLLSDDWFFGTHQGAKKFFLERASI